MAISDTNNLEKTILELDALLYKGYLLKTTKVDEWNYRSQEKDETLSLNEYEAAFEAEFNKWLNETAKLLFERFKEKHLYFHFIHPKPNAFRSDHPLGRLMIALGLHLSALEEVILWLEERKSLEARREIAEREYQADILYKVTFSWHTREIKLNNILLSRPNSDSKNLNFFEYVFAHQNEQIEVKNIEKETSYKLSDNVHDILRDLGFKGNVRKLFFPIATKIKVMFVNPITKQYAIKNDLPSISLSRITRHNEK